MESDKILVRLVSNVDLNRFLYVANNFDNKLNYMKDTSFHILRVGTAITFLWIGILILKDPEGWGSYISSWAANLLVLPIKETMISTAILDIAIGFFLLLDYFTWIAALAGALHLTIVLTVAGINAITVRDIGLLAATLALFLTSIPQKYLDKLKPTSSNIP